MPSNKQRVNLTLDDDTYEMLSCASKLTGVPVAGIVTRFLGAHMVELSEFLRWLEAQDKGSRKHEFGKNFLISYGPETLKQAIEQIDPTWKFASDLFEEGLTKDPLSTEAAAQVSEKEE